MVDRPLLEGDVFTPRNTSSCFDEFLDAPVSDRSLGGGGESRSDEFEKQSRSLIIEIGMADGAWHMLFFIPAVTLIKSAAHIMYLMNDVKNWVPKVQGLCPNWLNNIGDINVRLASFILECVFFLFSFLIMWRTTKKPNLKMYVAALVMWQCYVCSCMQYPFARPCMERLFQMQCYSFTLADVSKQDFVKELRTIRPGAVVSEETTDLGYGSWPDCYPQGVSAVHIMMAWTIISCRVYPNSALMTFNIVFTWGPYLLMCLVVYVITFNSKPANIDLENAKAIAFHKIFALYHVGFAIVLLTIAALYARSQKRTFESRLRIQILYEQKLCMLKSTMVAIFSSILPNHIVDTVLNEEIYAEASEDGSVLFVQLVRVQKDSEECTPATMDSRLMYMFDGFCRRRGCTIIDSIGPAYVCATGVSTVPPEKRTTDGSEDGSEEGELPPSARKKLESLLNVAFEMMEYIDKESECQVAGSRLKLKIGIATGPMVAGILCQAIPKFWVFGEPVRLAARLMEKAEWGKIAISEESERNLPFWASPSRRQEVRLGNTIFDCWYVNKVEEWGDECEGYRGGRQTTTNGSTLLVALINAYGFAQSPVEVILKKPVPMLATVKDTRKKPATFVQSTDSGDDSSSEEGSTSQNIESGIQMRDYGSGTGTSASLTKRGLRTGLSGSILRSLNIEDARKVSVQRALSTIAEAGSEEASASGSSIRSGSQASQPKRNRFAPCKKCFNCLAAVYDKLVMVSIQFANAVGSGWSHFNTGGYNFGPGEEVEFQKWYHQNVFVKKLQETLPWHTGMIALITFCEMLFTAFVSEAFESRHMLWNHCRPEVYVMSRFVMALITFVWQSISKDVWVATRPEKVHRIMLVCICINLFLVFLSYDAITVDYDLLSIDGTGLLTNGSPQADDDGRRRRFVNMDRATWPMSVVFALVYHVMQASFPFLFRESLVLVLHAIIVSMLHGVWWLERMHILRNLHFDIILMLLFITLSGLNSQTCYHREMVYRKRFQTRMKIQNYLERIAEMKHKIFPPGVFQEEMQFELQNRFPSSAVPQPTSYPETRLHNYREATMIKAKLLMFSSLMHYKHPWKSVKYMNELFKLFDELADEHKVWKAEGIGEVLIAGQAEPPLTDHNYPLSVILFAIDLVATIHYWSRIRGKDISVAIGAHHGECLGGTVGWEMQKYGIWGEMRQVLDMLESTSPKGQIHVSHACRAAVEMQIRDDSWPPYVPTKKRQRVIFKERGKDELTTPEGESYTVENLRGTTSFARKEHTVSRGHTNEIFH